MNIFHRAAEMQAEVRAVVTRVELNYVWARGDNSAEYSFTTFSDGGKVEVGDRIFVVVTEGRFSWRRELVEDRTRHREVRTRARLVDEFDAAAEVRRLFQEASERVSDVVSNFRSGASSGCQNDLLARVMLIRLSLGDAESEVSDMFEWPRERVLAWFNTRLNAGKPACDP